MTGESCYRCSEPSKKPNSTQLCRSQTLKATSRRQIDLNWRKYVGTRLPDSDREVMRVAAYTSDFHLLLYRARQIAVHEMKQVPQLFCIRGINLAKIDGELLKLIDLDALNQPRALEIKLRNS